MAAITHAELKALSQQMVALAEEHAERTKGTAQHKRALEALAAQRKILDEIERDG